MNRQFDETILALNMQGQARNSSVIRKIFEEGLNMAKKYGKENVYDFSLGNPSVPTPEKINETIVDIVKTEDSVKIHGYMKNAGFDETRQAVADYWNRRYGKNFTMENVLMTCGAAGGAISLLRILLNPKDEVICFAPFFTDYINYIANFDGKAVVVPADFETFQPNIAQLPQYINEKTKAIFVNSPTNPSGVIVGIDTLKALNRVLRDAEEKYGHPIYTICDEPYRELVYDGEELPYMPDYVQNCILCESFSKTMSLPGERIGYLIVPSETDAFDVLMNALVCAIRGMGYINAPSLMQLVIARCMDEKCNVDAYDRNRKLVYKTLTDLGFTCIKPQGAFYMMVKSPVPDENEFLAEAKKHNILMVPAGSWGAPGYVRLAYCVSYEMIERSIPAFEALAATYFGK